MSELQTESWLTMGGYYIMQFMEYNKCFKVCVNLWEFYCVKLYCFDMWVMFLLLIFFCFPFESITAVLSNKCGFQLQYQMIFCVWLLAFSPQLCEQLRRVNVVPALSDILQESVKEKVTRIILAAFRVCGEFLVCFWGFFVFMVLISLHQWLSHEIHYSSAPIILSLWRNFCETNSAVR